MYNKKLYTDNIHVTKEPQIVAGIDNDNDNIYPAQLHSDFINDNINQEKINKCWEYSRGVRCISGIDVFFCLLNGLFYNPILFFFMWVPLCGYLGAVQFNSIKTMLYVIYLYISWFSRVISICDISVFISHLPIVNSTIVNSTAITHLYERNGIVYDPRIPLSFISISCLIQLMIAVYTTVFLCLLYKLSSSELIILRTRILDRT